MNLFGIKIAKASYAGHIEDADLSQIAFDSTHPLPKLMHQGPFSYEATAGKGFQTIYTHNLGYIPLFLCYAQDATPAGGGFDELGNPIPLYMSPTSDMKLLPGNSYSTAGTYQQLKVRATTTTIDVSQILWMQDVTWNGYLYVYYDETDTI